MTLRGTTRRNVLLGGGALVGSAALAPYARAQAPKDLSGQTIVFADFGGTLRDIRRKVFFDPFEQATKARVISADMDMARFQLMADRGRGEWDLADLNGSDVVRFHGSGGLMKLPDHVTKSEYVPQKYKDYAVGGYAINHCIGYNKDELPKGSVPASWVDFFDLERFPGRRGLLRGFSLSALEAALVADGVPHAQVYPIDFDRAFAKLDTIRDQVVFSANFAAGQQALAQGSVAMTMLTSGRILPVREQNPSVDIVWNQAFLATWTASGVPVGAPNPEGAFALLDFMMDPHRQAQFAVSGYGPAAEGAMQYIDEKTLGMLPNSPEHFKVALQIDQEKLAQQREEILKKYLEWVGG